MDLRNEDWSVDDVFFNEVPIISITIRDPSEDVIVESIKRCGAGIIVDLKNPSEKIQIEALKKSPSVACLYVDKTVFNKFLNMFISNENKKLLASKLYDDIHNNKSDCEDLLRDLHKLLY